MSEYCYMTDGSVSLCDYGCCDGSCCGIPTATIIGIVIGGIMILFSVIGCIICIVCMCKKSGASSGVQPVHNNTNSAFVNNTHYRHPPPQPPPAYNQYPPNSNSGTNPVRNSYNDPVYPPGIVNSHPPPAYAYSEPSPRK